MDPTRRGRGADQHHPPRGSGRRAWPATGGRRPRSVDQTRPPTTCDRECRVAGVVQSNIVSLRCPRRVARGRTLKLWYLDSSAITKLDRTERWSAELLAWSEALGRDERL